MFSLIVFLVVAGALGAGYAYWRRDASPFAPHGYDYLDSRDAQAERESRRAA